MDKSILERLDIIEKKLDVLTNHGFKHSAININHEQKDNNDIINLKKIVGVK